MLLEEATNFGNNCRAEFVRDWDVAANNLIGTHIKANPVAPSLAQENIFQIVVYGFDKHNYSFI
jgi:hypothetical protein